MLKKLFAFGFGASALVAVHHSQGQTIPPSILNNPDLIVHQIGSGGGDDGGSKTHEQNVEDGAGAALNTTSASNPANAPVQTTKASVGRVTSRLDALDTTAGADSKTVVTDAAPTPFHLTLYTEFDWTAIRDRRGTNLDGSKFAPRIGGDIVVGPEVLVGGSFTYSYERRNSGTSPIHDSTSSFIFNGYIGKTFFDFLNVGLTGTYAYEHQITKSFGTTFYGSNNVFSISPFVGVAKTFGAWSFASTAVYVYQYNDFSVDANPPTGGFGNTDSHTYLQLSELNYAINDKFTVGALFNINVVVDQSLNRIQRTTGSTDDFWVTVGAKGSYQIFENVTSSVEFQADLANSDYRNYLTSVGLTWSF